MVRKWSSALAGAAIKKNKNEINRGPARRIIPPGEVTFSVCGGGCLENNHIGKERHEKQITTKTRNDRLSASGKFSVTFDDNGNGILFGFFNTDSKGWRAKNSLVFRLDGNGMKYWVFYEYGTQHWLAGGAGCFSGDAYQTTKTKPFKSDRTSHDWKLDYDPDGANGNGLITFTLDCRPWKLALTDGHKADGATFNRFGILNQQTTGGQIEAYFDDLTINGEVENFDQDPKWEARSEERR